MVEGVTQGFEKRLAFQGVELPRCASRAPISSCRFGYFDSVKIKPRQGIEFEVPIPDAVIVRGIDKQAVGQTAAEIRKVRPPSGYKGRGIRYEASTFAGRSGSGA